MRPTGFLMKSWRARAPQPENKVPFKVQMPLALKDQVSSKSASQKERGCLYEISLVFACMQKNNFENTLCNKEIETFHKCYSTYLTNKHTAKDQARKGILTPNAKTLRYNQVNQLMRKYPHV